MMIAVASDTGKRFIPTSGYKPMYHLNSDNVCPGCHRSHWYVGRMSAECAFCSTALPIDDGQLGQCDIIKRMDRQSHSANRGAFTINGRS